MNKKKMLIIFTMINMYILGFVIPLLAEAQTLTSGTGMQAAAGFSCSNLSVEINLNAEDISEENFLVTNEKGLTYDLRAGYAENIARSGTFSKVLNPSSQNVDFTGSRYLAISYFITTQGVSYGKRTNIIYDCQSNTLLASCNGMGVGQQCAWTSVKTYFPSIEVEYQEDATEIKLSNTEVLFGGHDLDYITLQNNGFLPLKVDTANVQILNDLDNEFKITKYEDNYLQYTFTPRKPGHKSIIVKIPHNDPFKPTITVTIPFQVPNREYLSLKLKKLNYKSDGQFATFEGSVIVKNEGISVLDRKAFVTIGLYNTESPANTQRSSVDNTLCSYSAEQNNYSTTIAKLTVPRLKRGKSVEIPFKTKKLDVAKHSLSRGDRLLFDFSGNVFVKSQPNSQGIIIGNAKDYSFDACYGSDSYGGE